MHCSSVHWFVWTSLSVHLSHQRHWNQKLCLQGNSPGWIVPTAIPHVCAMHELTTSQWIVPTAIPHVCAMHEFHNITVDCAYSNTTCLCNAWVSQHHSGLCLQQCHMFVQCMSSQHHSGLCLQQYHMFVQCMSFTTSQWIVPTAMPHVCAMHELTTSQWIVPTAIPHVCAMHEFHNITVDCAYSNATCLCNAWAHNITVDCAYSNTTCLCNAWVSQHHSGLCLQQYHMFVQCMSSRHHSGLCLQQCHMFVQCICSQSGLRLLLPHMFVQCIGSKSQSALSWWTCFRQPVIFVGCFVDFFNLFFLQSFLLVQTQPALQSPPKSKGGKQPVADNKRNTTQH